MTIQWGAAETSGGTGMRTGIEIVSLSSVNNASTTFVVSFTCWTNPGPPSGSTFSDNQTLDLSSSGGTLNDTSEAFNNTQSGSGSVVQRGGTFTCTHTYTGYGTSPGNIVVDTQINGVFNGITPNAQIVVAIPARPWADPAATTNCNAARVSDTQASVDWDNNSTTPALYGNIKLQRKTDGGSFALIATLGVVDTYSDTGIVANHKYRYRPNVLGANGTEVTGDESGDIWTTPGAPTALVATKLANGNIQLDWTNNVNYSEYSTRIEESQNGGAFSELTSVSGGVATYEHVAPSTSVTHTYRIRARSTTGSLNSSYSANSNTITLLATANAPTNLAPAGVARDAAEVIVFTWQHNPADGTPQSKYQLQYKVDAGSYTTVGPTTSTVSSFSLSAATLTNGHTITWRVATAGENGTVGAYSAESTFTTSARPTATISVPSASHNFSTLTTEWAYFQAQSSAQAGWQASLYDDADVLLEQISGTTETEGTFATALADGAVYTVTVAVTSAAGLTSAADEQAFTVTYLPPADATITASYDVLSGSMVLTVVGDDPVESETVEIDTITIQRSINGGDWVTVVAGLELSGDPLTAIVLDTAPTIKGTNTYRALILSALPSSAISAEEINITAEDRWSFLSAGPGFATVVRMRAVPNFGASASRQRALRSFAGRTDPVQYEGENTRLALSIAGRLGEDSSTPEEYEAIAVIPGVVLWREPTGRRVFASLAKVDTGRQHKSIGAVAFDLTRIDYTE